MQAQWRTINQAVTLLRNNGATTTAVESKEGRCGMQLFLRSFDAGRGCALFQGVEPGGRRKDVDGPDLTDRVT